MTQTSKQSSSSPPARATPRTPKQASRRRAPIDTCLDPELFKAFADPTRARLLACLAKCSRPCTVTEVAECCAVDFSVVSRHLAALARAGVLESERKGREVRYAVRFTDLVARLRDLADAIESCCPGGQCAPGACC